MPVPTPEADDDENKFVSRCMGDEHMQEYDQEQRAAICYRQYRTEKSLFSALRDSQTPER